MPACRCLCKLLDGIQDHYTYAQPGIQRTVFHTQELVRCAGGWVGWVGDEAAGRVAGGWAGRRLRAAYAALRRLLQILVEWVGCWLCVWVSRLAARC
jgi:hypothetical protein